MNILLKGAHSFLPEATPLHKAGGDFRGLEGRIQNYNRFRRQVLQLYYGILIILGVRIVVLQNVRQLTGYPDL